MKYTFDWKEYAKTAREMIAEGCVLLRNENHALPIQKGERVSVFGRIQLDYYKSGTGSGGMVNTPYVVSIVDGLKNCEEISINEELLAVYEEWIKKNPFDKGVGWAMEPWCQKEMPLSEKLVKAAAENSDIAVIVIGRSAGEDKDNSAIEGSYLLTKEENELLALVCQCFQRTAVVLNVGNIIDMKWVDIYQPQAVLYAWQGGTEGGNGIADVLTGRVTPCGKLADTIAYDITDYPSTENFGGKTRNFYTEDIYVGYRYFETIAKEKVQYPFGFGLSYTSFSWEVVDFTVTDRDVTIKTSVKNTGNIPGKEVIQVYYSAPQGKLCKPEKELIRFEKTDVLKPGEEQELVLSFLINEMASYDDSGVTGCKSCYVLECGAYKVHIGNSVRNTVPAGSLQIEEKMVTETLSEACAPTKAFKRLCIKVQPDGKTVEEQEDVPLRTVNLKERIANNRPKCLSYLGEQGYQLKDVMEGKVSMENFLTQLTDEDLVHMTRGEGMCSSKVTPGIAGAMGGVTERLSSFGIPVAGCSDGPSGIRMDCGTMAFSHPNGTLIACSFNKKLTERLYEFEGMELRRNKIDMLLGPGINIHRNPLNGRNFEYFSEDPYLTGAMAAAELKGMHKYGVTGTIKHFACNNQEVERHNVDSAVSERALREIYLKAFEMCVKEAGAYCIMSTYGPVNGIWTGSNYDLLTTILREEWNYKGLVMTDWWAKLNEEGEEGYHENTTMMVRAQNDVYMVNGDAYTNSNHDNTEKGLKEGKITRGELVRNAANICSVVMHSPVMEFFLGKEDEIEELNRPEIEKTSAVSQPSAVFDKDVILDISNLQTTAGSDNQYAITIPDKGRYRISFQMKSDMGELAQMTMTTTLNNMVIDSMTINGTNGKWIVKTVEFEVFVSVENYINFYFAQSGITIGEIRIDYVE